MGIKKLRTLKDDLELIWASYPMLSRDFIDLELKDPSGRTFKGTLRLNDALSRFREGESK